MQYLAFDVSKAKLDAVLTNLRSKEQRFQIENNEAAIAAWFAATPLPKKIIMGCEATGSYHLALARAAIDRGHAFKVLNPILTKQFTRATIRKKKTDRDDAVVIAKLLAQGEGRVFVWNPDVETAKRASRLQTLLARYEFGLRLHAQVNSGNAYLAEIVEFMREKQKSREQELREAHKGNPDLALLESITGIGWKSAFAIWSETGAIEKFASAKQLVAYAGFDPKIRQSGHSLNSQGKLTKRGSPYLRRALFLAANCARMHDPELKVYYWKKRGEGKKHTVAVCATARKLVARIYAVWSRRAPYLPSTA
jgi:transposase